MTHPTPRRLASSTLAGLSLLLTACGQHTTPTSFSKDVVPVLQAYCLECHAAGGQGAEASGLRMDSYANLMKGTRFGSVIKPGDSLSSTLVILVEGRADPSLRMPHGARPPVPADQIKTLRAWIDQGAQDN